MSQIEEELKALEGMTPEQRTAMLRAGIVPERMAEFRRSRDAEEDSIRQQQMMAQQFANSPAPIQTNSAPAAVAAIIANTLRGFGGEAIASQRGRDLQAAQAESSRRHESLMNDLFGGRNAAMDVRKRGLSDALRNYDGSI